jgi:hypothetical protein
VEEENLGNSSARQTFDWRNGKALDNARHYEGGVVGRYRAPYGGDGEEYNGTEIYGPLAKQNGSR